MSNIEQDTEKTVVIFRTFNHGQFKGEVDALFPYETFSRNYECMCYTHVGQHFEADYDVMVRMTRPATESEYANLKRELERDYGYNLEIKQRASRNKMQAAWDADRERFAALADKST